MKTRIWFIGLIKAQCLGYLNGIFMIIFFRWLYFGGVYQYMFVRVCVRACKCCTYFILSFATFDNAQMVLYHSLAIGLASTYKHKHTHIIRTHNINKSPYWIIILDFTLFFFCCCFVFFFFFTIYLPNGNMRRLLLSLSVNAFSMAYRPPSPPPPFSHFWHLVFVNALEQRGWW